MIITNTTVPLQHQHLLLLPFATTNAWICNTSIYSSGLASVTFTLGGEQQSEFLYSKKDIKYTQLKANSSTLGNTLNAWCTLVAFLTLFCHLLRLSDNN